MEAITGRSEWAVCQTGMLNHGHGYGTNRGAELAIDWFKPKYLFLVNPDCMWVEPVIDQLVEFLELHPKAALVGPKQMDSKRRITAGGIEGTIENPKHRFWHTSDTPNEKARDSILSPNVAGSAILIRAEVFEELGGMLESGHYYSETWLCYHAQAHGYETWYYGQPWMIHEWHRSSKMNASVSEGQSTQDRELFRAKCDSHDPPIRHN
jgi:GT2 family glycosyltransferase